MALATPQECTLCAESPVRASTPGGFFPKLFDTTDFPARWHCGSWDPTLGWLHIGSDVATWLAYVCIPVMLLVILRRRRSDLPVPRILFLFTLFILACGTTHLLDAGMFWWPAYRVLGLVKLGTALVSIVTVVALARVLPLVLQLRTPADLEREVDERTAALRESEARRAEAQDRAERADTAKSRFLAHMSHELRTAMAAVLGSVELLEEDAVDDRTRGEFVGTVRRNAEHQLELVNQVLDLSKIEAGALQVHLAPVCVQDVARTAIDLVRPQATEKGIALGDDLPEEDVWIRTDALRVRQVLVNLMSNAIKFTSEGSVRLRMEVADAGPDLRVRFAVQDTGVGLTREQMDRIFQPYEQASARTATEFGGTGLGLCISRELVRLLGGDLGVSSKVGEGSTFELDILGEREGALPQDAGERPESLDLTGVRVLLAEDQRDLALVVQHHLESVGCEVTHVMDGLSALDALEGSEQDLVLLDLQMPVLDGHETIRRIRGRAWAGPVVALTANPFAADRDRCRSEGFDDFVTKPVSRARLIAIVSEHAGHGQQGVCGTGRGEAEERPGGGDGADPA